MLTAKEAYNIASESYGWIFNLIEEQAKQQRFNLILDCKLDANIIKYLKDLDYKVEDVSIIRYEETPYGCTNKIVGEVHRTKISWEWMEQN